MPDFALLDKLKGNSNPPQVTVDDINNTPAVGMSPAEQDAYNEYQKQYQAAPEALRSTDYFPGMNEPINVGGYSGNIIGSTTLFAPGGALVPFGMMDARDAAVHKAALAKAKDVQDFRAKLKANPPTSKLTGINEDLTNSYFGYIDNEYKKALQKSGGDANKATFLLNQDQNFQKGLKSYHDLKANGDAVFNHLAEVDERIKNGDVVSEEYKEAARKAVSSMDPTSPDFKNFSQNFLRLGAEREFMKTFNEVTKGVVASELAKAGIDESNPDYLRIVESKVKSLGEDQKEAIVQGMNDIYRGSSIYKDVPQRMKKLLNYRIEDKNISVHNKPGAGSDNPDYSSAVPVVETTQNVKRPDGTNAPVYGEYGYNTSGKDASTTVRIPKSSSMRDAQGKKINQEAGYVEGTIGLVQAMPYDVKRSEWFTDAEVKAMKEANNYIGNPRVKFQTRAILNLTPVKGEDGAETKDNIIYIDASDVKGKLKNKYKGKGQKDFDDLIDDVSSKSEELNKQSKAESSSIPSATRAEWKANGWSDDQINKAVKQGKIKAN